MQRRTLLPTGNQTHPGGSFYGATPDLEHRPHHAGLGILSDSVKLFVGQTLRALGLLGNLIELATSIRALFIQLLASPGTFDPGPVVKFLLMAFISVAIQAGAWLLVLNLADSAVKHFEDHVEASQAPIVTRGETRWKKFLIFTYELVSGAMTVWWDITFWSSITRDGFIISLGTGVLFFSSLLLWPLGTLIAKPILNRRKLAKKVARQAVQIGPAFAPGMIQPVQITPIVDGSLVPVNNAGVVPYQHQR
ncbi:hypothetical protein KSF_108810 [Reticulibacter mediterranei]|uniref:Uncharacterized protein n=1 Tax=Reticulibacter mediterranei TaxID=2778369 RepID=A0A8J3IUH0_9CHLR|nr:hypothetical protein [Reticulibacter mediterranei]GHP00834.1 hypothetical protein KSF_108810 [Reticulibacter mediterranei]